MRKWLVVGVVPLSVLAGCASQMVQSSLREQCAKDGKQAFFTSTSQTGIPIFLETASVTGVCLAPENIGHLPASFGADIVRVRVTGFSGIGVFAVLSGSAAEKAGLRPSDFITEFQGRPISQPDDLMSSVEALPTGARVAIKVRRDGNEQALTVQL